MTALNASVARHRGATGRLTRRVLELVRQQPQTAPGIAEDLGISREVAWPLLKHLHEQGRVERVTRGVYAITEIGQKALQGAPVQGVQQLNAPNAGKAPKGQGWTPQREQWLRRMYPHLGPGGCAEALGMESSAVWGYATRRGLVYGDIPGHILLTELASLTEHGYTNLRNRAQRAGVLTYPAGGMDQTTQRRAMVPDWWADQVVDERQPPGPDDVPLLALREELALSKTHSQRLVAGHTYLRTPSAGGQAHLYVSRETAEELRQRRRVHRKPVAVGLRTTWQAYEAAGANGLTLDELTAVLGCSRSAIRNHTRALFEGGELERHGAGTCLSVYVYRPTECASQPAPPRRSTKPPGRPRRPA